MVAKMEPALKPSSAILLALVPGALIAILYFATAPQFLRHGYPSFSALLVSIAVILVPFEMGVVLFEGKKLTGRCSLRGAVPYTERIPASRFIFLVTIILFWDYTVSAVLARFDRLLLGRFFFWFPHWALPPENLYPRSGAYPHDVTNVVIGAGLILAGVVAPIVEEIYFRGYLLPRMSFAGRHAPLLNAVLFSAYHFTFPWSFVSRAIAVAPMAYVVARTRNVYVGMVTHILFNVTGGLLFLSRH